MYSGGGVRYSVGVMIYSEGAYRTVWGKVKESVEVLKEGKYSVGRSDGLVPKLNVAKKKDF